MPTIPAVPATTARVPLHTSDKINQRIHQQTEDRLVELVERRGNIDSRLEALNFEWDVERVVEATASAAIFAGTLFGWLFNRWFFLLPIFVSATLLQYALQGWCPPLPIFRNMGIRTSNEIDTERYVLKAVRGDFDDIQSSRTTGRVGIRRLLASMGRNYKAGAGGPTFSSTQRSTTGKVA